MIGRKYPVPLPTLLVHSMPKIGHITQIESWNKKYVQPKSVYKKLYCLSNLI